MQETFIFENPMAYNYPLLIKQLLKSPCTFDKTQEIVYKDKKRFTYADFYTRVCKLANALTHMGVKKGDTVAVMDYDSHRYLECYFAIPMIGAVLHTINIRLSVEQILYTIDHAEDDLILVHEDFIPLLSQIKGRIDTVKSYILLSEEENHDVQNFPIKEEYESLLAKQEESFDFPDFDENSIATTFYTTGTTGMPKGVFFSHRQIVLHTLGTIATLGTNPHQGNFHREDVYMPITPMFHVHAWGLPYVATMLGVKQVYPGKYAPDLLLELIEKEQVTFSHCVPTILHMLFNSKKIDNIDLSKWKVIIGGAALSKSLCMEGLRRGVDIFTGYGMSETCPILSLAQLDSKMLEEDMDTQARIRTKTGKPMGMVQMRAVDTKMKDINKDGTSTGEIVVRAPWLTQGYFKDEKTSSSLWEGGYLHTGDVANIDEKGFFKITDRQKDVIKIGGEWVSSLELEDIFAQHKSISEVAVISQDHEKWGEIPLALIVLKPEASVSQKELLHFFQDFIKKGIMARESMLLKIQFVESIEKTSVGKINKKELRQKYAKL